MSLSSLVLFVTKTVCLQRKEELSRYLRQLFALGPFIAQSRLVAEFFGIWKTDMEAHLRQEDRDPLALHPVVVHTTATTATISTTTVNEPATAIKSEDENKEEEEEEEEEKRDNKEEQLEQESKASTVAPLNSEHPSSIRIAAEPTVSAAANAYSTLNLVPDLSPSPSMVGSRITEWASTAVSTFDNEMLDLEMSSPTNSSPSSSPSPRPELAECSPVETEGSKPQNNDITARTIKKFKSLRRAHTTTSATPTRQSIFHQPPPKEGRSAQEEAREYSISSGTSAASSTTAGGPPPLPIPTGTQSQGTAAKAKSMKRSKTIVFRPEVTMQHLSSKNVIPPWNRIPSVVASSTASSTASSIHSPISPASPTTPVAGGSHHPFMSLFSSNSSSNNMVVGESVTATTPTSLDSEDRPRKLTMSQSKTMPSLALWSTDSSPSSPPSNTPQSPVHPLQHSSTTGSSGVRALLSSSYSATTLVAPWNRVNSSSETSTHLHSLIKISSSASSGQPSNSLLSPAELPSVPVELGRSFQKKEISQQRSLVQSQAALSRTLRDPASIPVLSHPPEARNKPVVSGAEISSTTSTADRRGSKSGMTHSISAPGGFLPLMTVSKPPPETPKKRFARRGSATATLHSPSLPTKQPVSILKNARQSLFGARKSSLTVPGSVMFPVQPVVAAAAQAAGPAIVTTFKIVLDADTIVALQVIEDQKFILTLPDLKNRVKNKLLKSNIQLPEKFDLLWSTPSSSPSTPVSATSFSSTSSTYLNAGTALRTDEELHRAIHTSKNHKVTLRCSF
ncbi:hypothetical protein BGZ68_005857 [Mortierella alpina]|nr:hypothetical protein BGZ68_005857 [Mortierella alpina]